jgi:3-methyladenine DNA glycosylase AlkD
MPIDIVETVRAELERHSSEEVKLSSQRFFKEPVRTYGVRAATTAAIARSLEPHVLQLDRQTVWAKCEQLFASDMLEEELIAARWMFVSRAKFLPTDWKTFRRWIDEYVANWATCDTFCNHAVGALADRYHEMHDRLLEWTTSPNRWVRRASAVSLVIPAREGRYLPLIFKFAMHC